MSLFPAHGIDSTKMLALSGCLFPALGIDLERSQRARARGPHLALTLDGFDAPLFAWVVHMADGIDPNVHVTSENCMHTKFFTRKA